MGHPLPTEAPGWDLGDSHHNSSLECLVCPEADDSQTQRIHCQFVVLYPVAENVSDAGGPLFPFELRMVRGIGEDFLEFNPRGIRGLAEIVKDDVLDLYIYERERTVLDIVRDDVVFVFLIDHRSLHVAVEKVESVGLVALDSEAISAEVELRPARQVILVFGFLRA